MGESLEAKCSCASAAAEAHETSPPTCPQEKFRLYMRILLCNAYLREVEWKAGAVAVIGGKHKPPRSWAGGCRARRAVGSGTYLQQLPEVPPATPARWVGPVPTSPQSPVPFFPSQPACPVPLLLPSSGPFSETQRVWYVPTSSACGRPRDTCDWRNDPHRTAVAVNQD
ncbi:hypothetical protein CTAM01_00093 [Colletotrichum tamarilloi]|uniref:Uncharacterized protein n=1 Tax=Colletotrichum tamarilloi TaxID=1209934 RepID=A0ABQ9RTJ4_9PEZI|nr:uncharacterized protein CTAM01_00093 [Colletotrichum tamarilloi]KAK1512698.1 hypothetical protein CTAM01_00093 [Colletotrichum tamarilloi]